MDPGAWRSACRELMETSLAAYLTTLDADGYPRTRAMLNLRHRAQYPRLVALYGGHEDDLLTYFTTNTSSLKVAQIKANPKAAAYYCDPPSFRGLMLGGDLEVIDDATLRHGIWTDGWERYYPGGPDDPDHTVLRLRPQFAEGWWRGERIAFRL